MIQNQADGEQNSDSLDAKTDRVSKEQPVCVGRVEITNHFSFIDIPDGTTVMRAKHGKANFFVGKIPEHSQNGWHELPQGTGRIVCFPGYRKTSGTYGEPQYSRRYKK